MTQYNTEQLQKILDKHAAWLRFDDEGERANLHRANLHRANLYGANLHRANLNGANLYGANLHRANLNGANLYGANLHRANLHRASLYGANLHGASLYGASLYRANLYGASLYRANLHGASLYGANLEGANLDGANLNDETRLPHFQLCEGTLNVWKRGANETFINLEIPAEAKRTATLTGRKCRAEYAKVLSITARNGRPLEHCGGQHDSEFMYKIGEIIRPDKYDDDIRVECTHGIHFFLTKAEAEEWG